MKPSKTLLLLAALALAVPAAAHKRNYLDTYGYYTSEKGAWETEFWTDLRNPDVGDDYWYHQTEVEYGVTDRYTLGVYGVFIDGRGFSALKVENRYRLSEPKQWPVDTALYLEFKDANGHKEQDEIEGKLILSKDIGRWNLTGNGIFELEREVTASGSEWELEPAIAVGAAYTSGNAINPGIELYSAEHKSRLTPGLYIDLLPEVRLNVGVGLGLEDQADDYIVKSILEIEL
ncbi:MAG: hypothetical protein AABZ44_00690 [Elusimicrobiota bacterium]